MIADLHALSRRRSDRGDRAAILSTRQRVFFDEVFGPRVEGHRQKHEHEAQTFKGKVGEQLLRGLERLLPIQRSAARA